MKVGFSKVTITPEFSGRKEPLQLAGYFPREFCTGVNDDVFVRAVYIEIDESDINKNLLLMSCDLIGLSNNVIDILRRKISAKIPVLFENILICCTHTHSSVDYSNFFIPGTLLSAIKSFLFAIPNHKELLIMMRKVIKLSKEAYDNRKKAKIGAGQTSIPEKERVMINRRYPNEKDKAQYQITTIKVISDEEKDKGSLIGVIFNYAIHGTVFPSESTLLSADWMGQAVKHIEDQYPNQNVNVIYINGCCADINPMSDELRSKDFSKLKTSDLYSQHGNWRDVQNIGEIVGKNALKIIDDITCQDSSNSVILSRNIKLYLKPPPFGNKLRQVFWKLIYRAILGLVSQLKKYAKNKGLKFVNFQEENKKKYIKTSVHVFYFADIIICSAPGEYFLELGNEVLEVAKKITKNSFIVELANDSIGYIFPISEFFVGGYETIMSLTPMAGEIITLALKKIVKNLKN